MSRTSHGPRRRTSLRTACLIVSLCAASGCAKEVSPEVLAARARLQLDALPEGAISIEQARQQAAESPDVVLMVKVGNRNFENWSMDHEATFFVSEGLPGSEYNVAPDHDPSTCPFCKWRWKDADSLAILEVVDAAGVVLPISARELLELSPGDELAVVGRGEVDETGFLKVQVSGVWRL
ncbi:MAG: hypothetical protein KF774_14975 [Planctomyces sp.]|nr:hypothetical protein [Planctomyces sp.]